MHLDLVALLMTVFGKGNSYTFNLIYSFFRTQMYHSDTHTVKNK